MPIEGLEEDRVWSEHFGLLASTFPHLVDNPRVGSVLNYAFTEMLNNAIDHSDGSAVRVSWNVSPELVSFEIEDDGIGVFRQVCEKLGLAAENESIGELAKGKQTTAPEHHSGMGIFFTSKIVDTFNIASGNLAWTIDRVRSDQAIGWFNDPRIGTLVRCEVSLDTDVVPKDIFDRYSNPETFEFANSTVRVGLFRQDGNFVSRSEAKRLASNLENFENVEIDFADVSEVGQGFIDELFRVWSRSHPTTRLAPINANPAVVSMIAKAVTPTSDDKVLSEDRAGQLIRRGVADRDT